MLHGLIMDFQFSWVCSAPRIHQFVTQSSFWWCIHTKVFYIDLSFSMVQGPPMHMSLKFNCNKESTESRDLAIRKKRCHWNILHFGFFLEIRQSSVILLKQSTIGQIDPVSSSHRAKKSKGCHCWFSKRLPQSESQSWGETFLVEGNPFLLFSAWPLLVLLSSNWLGL